MASPAAVLSILVTANTAQAQTALTRTNAQLSATAANANKATAATGALGRASKVAGAAVAGGLAYGLYKTVTIGMDFERQMSALGAVTDATAKDMEALKKQAIDMGAATTFGAREVAQAQTELAKGGLKTSQILGGALKSALDLAAAGDLDLAEAAKTTTNAMNLFNIKAEDSIKVADMLATAANTTTADVDDFARALTQGGSAAKSAGLNMNQTVTILEALAENGIKNSDAGTSMKAALIQLAAPTQRQTDLTKKLNLEFFNQQGEMKGPIKMAAELQDALGGMTKQQQTATLKTIAGTDGFRTLFALLTNGPDKLRKLSKANEEQGTAAEVAAEKTDNLAGDLERLQGSAESLALKLYDYVNPALRELAQGATTVIDELTTTGGGKNLLTDSGPLTDKLKELATTKGPFTKMLEKNWGGAWETIQGIFEKPIKLNIDLSVGAIVGKAKAIWQAVKNYFGKRIDLILAIRAGIPEKAKQIWETVKDIFNRAHEIKVTFVSGIIAKARALWDRVTDIIDDIDIDVNINLPDVGGGGKFNPLNRPFGFASGAKSFRGGMALVNERGPEMAQFPNGATSMLGNGKAGAQLTALPAGTQIFTASETKMLQRLGVPAFAKGTGGTPGIADLARMGNLVFVGKTLQDLGYAVAEHPKFGGVGGGHSPSGYHPRGMAIDVNADSMAGGEKKNLDAIYGPLRANPKTLELLWQTADHYDHLHQAMSSTGPKWISGKGPASAATRPTLGGIPGIFAKAVVDKKSPKAAALALFAAGYAESGMRDIGYGMGTSEGVLQVLASTAASSGVDPHNEQAVAEHFLTRGWTGRGSANSLARAGMGFAQIATTVQGNSTGAGVYSAQGARALRTMRRTGLKWKDGRPVMTGTAAATKAPAVSDKLRKKIAKLMLPPKLQASVTALTKAADDYEEWAQRAEDLGGPIYGGTNITWLQQALNELFKLRNLLVHAHQLAAEKMKGAKALLRKTTGAKPRKAIKEQIAALSEAQVGFSDALTEVQGAVGGGQGMKVLKSLPATGVLGGRIFDVQMKLKDANADASATDSGKGLTPAQLKEIGYLRDLGVKFNPSQFAGFFAQGGMIGRNQWGIAGEAGAELVTGPARITPTGGITILLEDHRTRAVIDGKVVAEIVHDEVNRRDRDAVQNYRSRAGVR